MVARSNRPENSHLFCAPPQQIAAELIHRSNSRRECLRFAVSAITLGGSQTF